MSLQLSAGLHTMYLSLMSLVKSWSTHVDMFEQNLKDRVLGFGPDVDSQLGVKLFVHLDGSLRILESPFHLVAQRMVNVKKDLAAEYKSERDVVRIEHHAKAARDFIFMWI
jgi:hypothetical protein